MQFLQQNTNFFSIIVESHDGLIVPVVVEMKIREFITMAE